MNQTLASIIDLVTHKEVRISSHGYDELADDDILTGDVIASVKDAQVIEDYPHYHKGACILVLQKDRQGAPLHVVWGIPKGASTPAVLITAYRPNSERWSDDFLRRK